jgi:sugar O-acyltransferase (sialic acid O-acetyltransferase NeuD family)
MEKQEAVIIIGANGIGRVAKDIFENNGQTVFGYLDDNKNLHQTELDDVTVLGSTEEDTYLKLIGKKCDVFIATDDIKMRASLVKSLNEEYKVQPMNCIHAQANVSKRAAIGYGNFINANASIGANVTLGNHCMIHSNAIVDYDATVEDFVQIGAGAIVNAGVIIKEQAFIGSGAVLVSGITIGKKARIGAGSVVIASVKDGETVFGNPAQTVKS